jgi:hypothetical protein
MELREKIRNEVISARILAKTVDEAVDSILLLLNVVRADCEHSNIKNECQFPYGHRKICQDCGKDFTI